MKRFRVDPPRMPDQDLSGNVGQRLLALLSTQAERNLKENGYFINGRVRGADRRYGRYSLGGCASMFTVLARYGKPGRSMVGTIRQKLETHAAACVEAVARTHRLSGAKRERDKFASGRFIYLLGMGAWLNWDKLPADMQLRVARIIAYETDRFLASRAPAKLYKDTQAESNAWTGGGIAVASCMLKNHPNRARWAEKANEYMISAYATARDTADKRLVDGKPLADWLRGPNAFNDHTVENHGIVHPDYIAAISEMIRSTLAYRMAGLPAPEAATFNADKVFDRLMFLTLPDGSHFYPHGTDYTPRRIDSFFQACNIVPLKPDPRRKAFFLRSLGNLEAMATRWPVLPMHGWLGFPLDLGCTWGVTQNYLLCRLSGNGGRALNDTELEASLAGVHKSGQGRFVMHRTDKALSSFSWHPKAVMGMTMPLDRDTLCYPMPLSTIGELRERLQEKNTDKRLSLKVRSHRAAVSENGFSAMADLELCAGKVLQHCALVSLPNGMSVYLPERRAVKRVEIGQAVNGRIAVFDDMRWPHQRNPRRFFSAQGEIRPDAKKPSEAAGSIPTDAWAASCSEPTGSGFSSPRANLKSGAARAPCTIPAAWNSSTLLPGPRSKRAAASARSPWFHARIRQRRRHPDWPMNWPRPIGNSMWMAPWHSG